MATLVEAMCSECFLPQTVELNPRRSEITCLFCTHSVQMFAKHDMDGIRAALAIERRKTLMALAFFAGAVFLFGLYMIVNSGEDMVQLETADGIEKGYLRERTDSSVAILDPETDEERTRVFSKVFAPYVAELIQRDPTLAEAEAAGLAGEDKVKVLTNEPGAEILLVFSVLAALGAIVLSAIATQERLLCEF